jgi:hypothetical protein
MAVCVMMCAHWEVCNTVGHHKLLTGISHLAKLENTGGCWAQECSDSHVVKGLFQLLGCKGGAGRPPRRLESS